MQFTKRIYYSSILLISFYVICAHSDLPRPRGVSFAKASLYSPTKDFTCFDGTVTIPFTYVNDDYCDCFDGSDEPGTSACLNGVFHCTNAGHRSQNIPSSRVNDGVCDCCDGTDEYAAPDTCSDNCEELGREAKAEAIRLAELHKAGTQIRVELIEKGNKKRSEMAEQLAQLEKDKEEAEKIKTEKETLKDELEAKENDALKVYREAEEREKQKKAEEEEKASKQEAKEHFERYDSDSDGQLTLAEIQTRNVFDKDKDGEVSEDEIKHFFGEDFVSTDYETFCTNAWPLIKPFIMMEEGLFKKPEVHVDDPAHDENFEADDDADAEGELEADAEDPDVEDIKDNLDDHDDEQYSESSRTYDAETQKLVDEATEARQQYTSAERAVREIESSLKKIKEDLEKDYGLQQEYASLDGQCYEYEDKEYIYKVCLFEKVTQKSKNGGAEVSLGVWGEWAGPEDNKYSVMKYTNGMGCWNGPNRVTTVNIHCDLDSKIISVSEPFRCEYKMELATPAACDESKSQHVTHDEL